MHNRDTQKQLDDATIRGFIEGFVIGGLFVIAVVVVTIL